jgi:1,4-alpha-glucan branching enzyme
MIPMKHTEFSGTELYLFSEGSNACAYQFMGSHPCEREGEAGFVFRVWAPNARGVSLCGDFNFWSPKSHPMNRLDGGVWELFVPGLKCFSSYKYNVFGANGKAVLKADPYAFHSETRPGTASKTYDPSLHRWNDSQWLERRESFKPHEAPINIYEMHIGSWRLDEEDRLYTYERLADELIPYLLEMGYTHVEFLPLTEYPYDGSWGYQVSGYFAPTSRYGPPMELVKLIDRLHQAEIGVIMDWVPAHFPRDEFALRRFDGTPLYEHPDPRLGENQQWGTHMFDFTKGQVRSFLLSSAMYWLKEFHIDGLRVDAVSFMLYLDYCREGQGVPMNKYGGNENLEAIAFLQKLNELCFRECPGIMMIAEEATSYPMVTRPKYIGGLGFNFKWNMGWMNDTLSYMKLDPIYRSYYHEKLTFSMFYAFSENYVLALSHDEVVHGKHSLLDKMPGDYWQKFAGLRALYGYQMSHPGKKMLFMGGEFGQFIEWKELDQLDWFLTLYEPHAKIRDYVRRLNHFYRETPCFWARDGGWDGFRWLNPHDNGNSVISFLRMDGKGNAIICVHNFTPQYLPEYRIPLPYAGRITPLLCSDAPEFGGSGKGDRLPLSAESLPFADLDYSVQIELAPLASMFFKYDIILPEISPEKAIAPQGETPKDKQTEPIKEITKL